MTLQFTVNDVESNVCNDQSVVYPEMVLTWQNSSSAQGVFEMPKAEGTV
jgi:hypothetical protein